MIRQVKLYILAVEILALVALPARAQKKEMSPEQQKQMEEQMKAAQPGPVHAQMAKRVGNYAAVAKVWIQPGAEPQTSTGEVKITSAMGGRFLGEEGTGTFLGQPSSGMRLWGYNNGAKQYEATWTYTGSTSILMLMGTTDDGGKTVIYTGTVNDATPVKLHVVLKTIDDDHFMIALRGEYNGAYLETAYTRKK